MKRLPAVADPCAWSAPFTIFLLLTLMTLLPLPCMAQDLPVLFEDSDTMMWGYADGEGQAVIAAEYVLATDFLPTGIAAVATDKGWTWIDTQGTPLAKAYIFDNFADEFNEGLTRIVDQDKVGYMDENGAIAIDPQFDFAGFFENGQAPVCMGCVAVSDGEHSHMEGGQWACIDPQGRYVTPLSEIPVTCGQ